ncbi:putative PurR-regulated permease PerM [Sediminihabitans luteus]|uniref:Putative PurR-regulated permease PerM n=1 Tax=Sediminihabitans luteus TaxID=1138585 RepID=A0A2M9D130_9CELL|nr:AI-2E family transporter [Sediminihabitans luteus]PJJ77916.1 putative PurR-regulated permease PerM [Sediminihabitans luteus]GII99727.1 AI-2E family transporter [Sediminihabitans luteus]
MTTQTTAPDTAPAPGMSPTVRTLVTLAAAVVVLAGVHAASGILGPLLLAAVIVIIVMPVREPLVRRGWPGWLATTGVIVTAYLILAALLAMLVFAGVKFGQLVADYLGELRQTVDDLTGMLQNLGLDTDVADLATSWLEPGKVLSIASNVSGIVVSIGTAFFFVLAYAIFMSADAARYGTARTHFGRTHGVVIDRVTGYNRGVRRYFVVNASFGLVVAVIDGLALWALGVPAPVVWAILAFVTNFVPNIGFILGLVPPLVMALVVGGWPLALAVAAVYCVVNVVLQVLVQPKFVSDTVSLSLTLSFMSVIFWTFIIGPLGAILAIPLTLLTRALILEPDPGSGWLRWLSGDGDAAPKDPLPDDGAAAAGDADLAPAVVGAGAVMDGADDAVTAGAVSDDAISDDAAERGDARP